MKTLVLGMMLLQGFPSVEGWEKVTETHYEIKNTIKLKNRDVVVTTVLGSWRILKNPADQNEFVLLVLKYPPLTFVPPLNQTEENSQDEIVVAENYFQKTKHEKLKEKVNSSDIVLLIKWRESKDPRTEEKILEGPIKNWLLKPNDEWVSEESAKHAVKTELLSEEGLLVGFKLSLGENYHILRFNQSILGSEK